MEMYTYILRSLHISREYILKNMSEKKKKKKNNNNKKKKQKKTINCIIVKYKGDIFPLPAPTFGHTHQMHWKYV